MIILHTNSLVKSECEPKRAGGLRPMLLCSAYDREPATLNRFSIHILEDTMICITEGSHGVEREIGSGTGSCRDGSLIPTAKTPHLSLKTGDVKFNERY